MTADASRPGLLHALGGFFFKYRNGLFPLVFLCLALASRPILVRGELPWDRWLDGIGILAVALGQVLRVLVIGLVYIRRGGLDKQVYADRLIREGIFAHSRNPLYLGNLLALFGFCLIHHSWLCYLIGAPFFVLAYVAIVHAEEDFLRRKFGEEYEAYCREAPRFRLRLRGLRGTIAERMFDWRRVLRKEYGTTFSGVTFVLFLFVWDRYLVQGWAAARPMLPIVLSIWIPCVLLYLLTRWLKKANRLGTRHAETEIEGSAARS